MLQGLHDTTGLRRRSRTGRMAWSGYAACGWALLFAAQSFYYAAGGTAGAETWPPVITAPVLARDPVWVAIMWGTGIAKVLLALLGLALVQPWGRLIPRWMLLTAAWGTGVLLAFYGIANWIQHGLMEGGVLPIPAGLGHTAERWHLLLWDPWWLLGGILFCAAAWHYQCRTRA